MSFVKSILVLLSLCAVLSVAFPQEPKRLRPIHFWPLYPHVPHGNPEHPQTPQEPDSHHPTQDLSDEADVSVDTEVNNDTKLNQDIHGVPQMPKPHHPHIFPHYPHGHYGNPHFHPKPAQELDNKESPEPNQDLDEVSDYVANEVNNDIEVDDDIEVNEVN